MSERIKDRGVLVVLTGETGSGKDTVMGELLKKGYERVVTHNAGRGPRPGEQNHVDYHFVSEEEFSKMEEDGSLIEYINYAETKKGTSKMEIEKIKQGKKIVWRIDPTAASRVDEIIKEHFLEEEAADLLSSTVVIYLKSESEEIVVKRAIQRNPDEKPEVVWGRIRLDKKVYEERKHKFPHVVVNKDGQLKQTVELVEQLVEEGHNEPVRN